MTDPARMAEDISRIASGLAASRSAVEHVAKKLDAHDAKLDGVREDMAGTRADLASMKAAISQIEAVVIRGNGQPPLQTRTSLLESRFGEVSGQLARLNSRVGAIAESQEQRDRAESRNRATIIVAMIGALAGLATTAINLISN